MKRILLSIAVAFATLASLQAQDKVVQKILEIGKTDNRTMYYDDYLSSRIGGRVVGSHNLEDAEKWVAKQFKSMGLEVMVQEVGEINVGFSRDYWTGRVISNGLNEVLDFGTPSYTAGTHGVERGIVVMEPTTQREFDSIKGKLKGAWVLIGGKSNGMAIDWSEAGNQKRAEQRAKNEEIQRQNAEIARYNREHPEAPKATLQPETISVPFYKEMVEAGILGIIQAGDAPMQIHYDRANCYNITMDNLPNVCDIKLNAHQYEAIAQKVKDRETVELEFDIRNHFFEGPVKYHNIIGILKGSKYPDEYVLMGGHLDAYDSATGSVDDANGVALTLEAARMLTTAGAKPKRSIMFCVWTGEEYGLLGSKFFVENKTVPLNKISNYFNRDGGPLASTGITVPEAMYNDFVKITEPLKNFDPEMPFTLSKREGAPRPRPTTAGGSDHAYFAMNGVPTLSFSENDYKGYGFVYRDIWHTKTDILNAVYPDYMDYSTVITAVTVYGVANLDHLLSREGLYSN